MLSPSENQKSGLGGVATVPSIFKNQNRSSAAL